MKAVIVTIGDEILIGQITDTNSGYIAQQLEKIGIQVHQMLSISDDAQQITQTLHGFLNAIDLVIMTGGLGPTKDDITKKTLCDFFNDHFIRNQAVETQVNHLFINVLGKQPAQVNLDQALVPSKAEVLFNQYGTAPGIWMQKEETIYVSMPGVPYEMKGIVDNHLIPKLVTTFQRPYTIHKTFLTLGEGESVIAERLETIEDNLPSFVKLAYLPRPGSVRLRLTARHQNITLLEETIKELTLNILQEIPDIFVGFEEEISLVEKIQQLMVDKNLTLSTAESCTGGAIASEITQVAGSSAYFVGSIVCYDTKIKINHLGVSQKSLDTHNVVSTQVAKEMAWGIKQKFNTNIGIATTGHAGPAKKESDESLGTVCIAVVGDDFEWVEKFNFGQPRQKVINRAVSKAFEMLLKELTKK